MAGDVDGSGTGDSDGGGGGGGHDGDSDGLSELVNKCAGKSLGNYAIYN